MVLLKKLVKMDRESKFHNFLMFGTLCISVVLTQFLQTFAVAFSCQVKFYD